jgi:hypothetical protein
MKIVFVFLAVLLSRHLGAQCTYINPDSLTWDDYKGQPRKIKSLGRYIEASANTNYRFLAGVKRLKAGQYSPYVSVQFCRDSSFVKSELVVSSSAVERQLFQHELYHYKLVILYAKRLRHYLTNHPNLLKGKEKDVVSRVKELATSYSDQKEKEDDVYELETRNGTILPKQKLWVERIDKELKKLGFVRLDQ